MNMDFNSYVSVLFGVVTIAISVIVGISLKQGTGEESKGKNAYVRNGAKPHDVGKWVDNMKEFMRKPIYKQLLALKGTEEDLF